MPALLGVDRDFGLGALQEGGRGYAQRTTTDNGDIASAVGHGFLDGDGAGTPGELSLIHI